MQTGQGVPVPWDAGTWTNEPALVENTELGLTVTASANSDAWRATSAGLTRATENALLVDLTPDHAVEVAFIADMTDQYDQAGVFLKVNDENWAKAGMELTNGLLQLGSVVTKGESDWSACCMPDWNGRSVRMRASWRNNIVIVRASVDGDPYRLFRLFPLDDSLEVKAGPFLASPSREGLTITFTDWRITEADRELY